MRSTVPRHRRASTSAARDPAPAGAGRRRSALRPRDWRVRTKLAAVLVVPGLAFLFVAGLQTSSSVRQATALSQLAEQVAFGEQVSALVHELQFTRDRISGELAAVAAAPPAERDREALADALAEARAGLPAAREAFEDAAAPLRDASGLREPLARATAALAELETVDAGAEQGWLRQRAVFDGYTAAIEALLALLRAPPAVLGVAGVAAVADTDVRAYQDLAESKEITAQIRGQVFALASTGSVTSADTERLADARAQRRAAQERFRANATPAQLAVFDDVVRGQAVRGLDRLEQQVLEQSAGGDLDLDPEQWWSAATTQLELVREAEGALLAGAYRQVAQASSDLWRQTWLVSAATLLILVVAALTSIGIGRSMVRSLQRLREQAIDVADTQLPGLLARLRGARGAVPVAADVPQVSAGGADEVGDVAEAFTQVHRSAVDLAVEQAVMRRNVNSIFVNLARRSQVLVERQLEMLDELELEETDPGQLRSLFRLDHLATRMRRNNESLLVLTDSDVTRPYHRPVPLTAVVLAAIAEIEQYERVREQVVGDLHVVGRAVADLVHLLAELLDNAASFSARDTAVVITGHRLPEQGGALVEVVDSGLGMSQAALDEVNALLASPPAIDVAASERMGLVVVSHLAARHEVQVRLTSTLPGVRASVWLPAALLTPPPEPPAMDEPTLRTPVLPTPDRADMSAPDRGAVRAEDVLTGAAVGRDAASTWWSPQPRASSSEVGATLLAPAPEPVVGGTSTHGLPVRVPLAQLPGGQAPAATTAAAAWRPGDFDPDDVGSTLSRLYSGVRRAESEVEEGTSGEPEQGST